MAHVSIDLPDGERFRGSDRGQLLVVAGLVMAVSLVALVVLLNATIYSENVATRGIEAADGEATEVRAATVEGVGETIDAVNRAHEGEDPPTDAALADIDELEERLGRSYARRGATVQLDADASRTSGGDRVDTAGKDTSLANATNATSYTVAGNIDGTRGFVLDLEVDSLASSTAGDAADEAFHVVVDPAGNERREVYVYRDDGSDDVVVAAGDGGEDPAVVCTVDPVGADRVSVDVTGEQLDGEPCVGLWPSDRLAPGNEHTLEVGNGDAADGVIRATVRPTNTELVTDVDDADTAGAVYDATVDLTYRTAELRFETTLRVAPGEPDA